MTKDAVLGGKYRLEELLGEGSTGKVFRAHHLDLERPFALKALKARAAPGSLALARFRQEAEALGCLQHPNIVDEADFGIDPATGTAYLVLEYLEGCSLAELLRQKGSLPFEHALPVLAQIAAAVDGAHSQGVLHRDLKPANVFLQDRPGAPPLVKVLDFGLAELVGRRVRGARRAPATAGDPALTPCGALTGTPHYAAPEVIRDQHTSPASDVYSFGVLAYEMLAGRPPFCGTTSEVLDSHLERLPPPIPGLVPDLERGLLEMLHKEPARRPPSATAGVARLAQAAARGRQRGTGGTPGPVKWNPRRHHFQGERARTAFVR